LSLLLSVPPTPTLFPYTTLFRSVSARSAAEPGDVRPADVPGAGGSEERLPYACSRCRQAAQRPLSTTRRDRTGCSMSELSAWWRSEEHTSELQSRENLVCRLLLE